jgi:aminoglycoside phosphotransferase (APT) family kinase protein
MPAKDMPAAEVEIDEALVRGLLQEQHPDLARWPLRLLANGWDNVLFRLGDELVVRLPRRELAVPLVAHEQRWLPELAPRLPLPIPVPVRVGRPGAGYPWPWSVCAWMPGESALVTPPTDLGATAETLGRFLAALHVPAPADAPVNPFRGIPLADRQSRTLDALDRLGDLVDGPRLRALWDELAATPAWQGPPVWVHGDTHPGNLVVHEGRLTAVVDWGDLCSGDPASDLVVAWMLFPPEHRATFRTAVGAGGDDHLWTRGRAWALAIGLALSAESADNPAYAALAARTLAAATTDP